MTEGQTICVILTYFFIGGLVGFFAGIGYGEGSN